MIISSTGWWGRCSLVKNILILSGWQTVNNYEFSNRTAMFMYLQLSCHFTQIFSMFQTFPISSSGLFILYHWKRRRLISMSVAKQWGFAIIVNFILTKLSKRKSFHHFYLTIALYSFMYIIFGFSVLKMGDDTT